MSKGNKNNSMKIQLPWVHVSGQLYISCDCALLESRKLPKNQVGKQKSKWIEFDMTVSTIYEILFKEKLMGRAIVFYKILIIQPVWNKFYLLFENNQYLEAWNIKRTHTY